MYISKNLLLGLMGCALLFMFCLCIYISRPSSKFAQFERIDIVDSDGLVTASLYSDGKTGAVIQMMSTNGKSSLSIRENHLGNLQLSLSGNNLADVILLDIGENGPSVAMGKLDVDKAPWIAIAADGQNQLTIKNENRKLATIRLEDTSKQPIMTLFTDRPNSYRTDNGK